MKKYLVILLSLVFALSTVGVVFADDAGMDSVRAMKPGAKVQIGGDARVRGIWFKNPTFDSDADNDNRFYDQRIRLKFKGEAGNGISANLRLYITNSPKWDGTRNTNGRAVTGSADLVTGEVTGSCDGCILVDYAYISIPVSTVTIDAGLMKENFGNTLYLYDDRYDILKVSGQFESVKVSVFTRKIVDTFDTVTGDDNLKDFNDYGATLVANVNDIEAGAIIVFHHDNRVDPVTGDDNDNGTDISLFANAAMSGINVGGELTFLTGDINKTPEDKTPLGLMLFAKTTVGAIGVRADFAFASNLFMANNNYVPSLLIGTDQNTAILNFASIADEEKAWLAAGTVDTDVMENVNVKGRVAYWSAKDGAGDTNSLLELDGIVSYQIAKNARYIVEAAYGNPSDEIGEDAIIVLANKAELYF